MRGLRLGSLITTLSISLIAARALPAQVTAAPPRDSSRSIRSGEALPPG
jgi:hypothetical protein